jgi:uncharacterized YigZ family protein
MLTLAAPHAHEVEIKQSRFLARAARADGREAALAYLEQVREARASHNCWAYKVGQDYRFNDDGEPGGTAGQPILRAIEGQGLDHVVVVVARWFGGIKLGAGGLVRAYGGTAAECLRLAPRVELLPRVTLRVEAPFEVLGALHPLLEQHGAERGAEAYSADGLSLELRVREDRAESLERALRDATRGRAKVTVLGAAEW